MCAFQWVAGYLQHRVSKNVIFLPSLAGVPNSSLLRSGSSLFCALPRGGDSQCCKAALCNMSNGSIHYQHGNNPHAKIIITKFTDTMVLFQPVALLFLLVGPFFLFFTFHASLLTMTYLIWLCVHSLDKNVSTSMQWPCLLGFNWSASKFYSTATLMF